MNKLLITVQLFSHRFCDQQNNKLSSEDVTKDRSKTATHQSKLHSGQRTEKEKTDDHSGLIKDEGSMVEKQEEESTEKVSSSATTRDKPLTEKEIYKAKYNFFCYY